MAPATGYRTNDSPAPTHRHSKIPRTTTIRPYVRSGSVTIPCKERLLRAHTRRDDKMLDRDFRLGVLRRQRREAALRNYAWSAEPPSYVIADSALIASTPRGSSPGSRYSIPSGPIAVTWVTYSPDFAQWEVERIPGQNDDGTGRICLHLIGVESARLSRCRRCRT